MLEVIWSGYFQSHSRENTIDLFFPLPSRFSMKVVTNFSESLFTVVYSPEKHRIGLIHVKSTGKSAPGYSTVQSLFYWTVWRDWKFWKSCRLRLAPVFSAKQRHTHRSPRNSLPAVPNLGIPDFSLSFRSHTAYCRQTCLECKKFACGAKTTINHH